MLARNVPDGSAEFPWPVRVVDSLADDKRLSRTDPIRAPPGACTDLEVKGRIVIPTPIAVEINDFQIL
jgi:hypothetical protein